MSFLSNLFKKKPGGTTVGNLLRGVGSIVGLGKGQNKVPVDAKYIDNKWVLPDGSIWSKGGNISQYVESVTSSPTVQSAVNQAVTGSASGDAVDSVAKPYEDTAVGRFMDQLTRVANPSVSVGPDQGTKTLMYIGLGLLGFMLLNRSSNRRG